MKVIFLDLDGVMSSTQSVLMDDFCVGAVFALNSVLRTTGAKIVFSTSWREIYPDSKLEQILIDNGVDAKNRVLGHTPIGYLLGKQACQFESRGEEIYTWLEYFERASPGKVSGICILDDKPQVDFMSPWLVLTDSSTGLKQTDVKKILHIINKPFVIKNILP